MTVADEDSSQQVLPGIVAATTPVREVRFSPLSPSVVLERPHLQEWLARRRILRLRFIVAPFGFGKSLLLQRYAAGRANVAYVHASELTRPQGLLRTASDTTREFLIDDVDAMPPAIIAELLAQIHASPAHLSFALSSRTREIIPDHRCLIDGTADLLDAHDLAFTWPEIAVLCDCYGVKESDLEVRTFLRESDGWPMLVHAAIKKAKCERRPLRGLFRAWIDERGAMLRETIENVASKEVVERLLARGRTLTIDELRALERKGHFVLRNGDEYAVLQAVEALSAREQFESVANEPPISMELLGEFGLSIGRTRVKWLRRRDAQVVKYLAMSPGGRAKRHEVCRAFWPNNERAIALQNLRTTCSNIRAAFRAAAPTWPVERYFISTGSELQLIFDPERTDLARFNTLIAAANVALDRQLVDEAARRLELAYHAYRGPLIVEPPNAFYADAMRELEERFAHVQDLRTRLRLASEEAEHPHVAQRSPSTSPTRSLIRGIVPGAISRT